MHADAIPRWLPALAALALAITVPTAQGLPAARAAYPGSNGKIAFVSMRDGNAEIYTVNPDGGGLVRLTNNEAGDLAPAWSPDGTRIAFGCGIGSEPGPPNTVGPRDICVMNADGSGLMRLTNDLVPDSEPTWSPDGSRIAFWRDWDIYTMKPDGTNITRLTTDAAALEPAWSPDGAKIAYTSLQSPCPGGCPLPNPQPFVPQIFVMNADGTGMTDLSNDPQTEDTHPAWSPDGTRIAYKSHPSAGGAVAIWLMDPHGSDRTRITPVPGNNSDPAWSPDGARIAFTRCCGDPPYYTDVFVMNSDGTGATAVTNLPGFDGSPDWQPVPNVRLWTATVSDAGLSGTASLELPANGWATAAFKLRHLVAGVSVSARVVAGVTGCAKAATVVKLPGFTTTMGGTWSQRWVFDGGSLDRLRAAARSGAPLWFEVGAGEHRTCARLVEPQPLQRVSVGSSPSDAAAPRAWARTSTDVCPVERRACALWPPAAEAYQGRTRGVPVVRVVRAWCPPGPPAPVRTVNRDPPCSALG